MNRFDRVTSLLLLLQTRSVVTAQFLATHFGVTERTIYRDIRTLENAGVPIGAEAGVGYFLERGYRLPPVSFTLDEAGALLLGEKLLVSSLDAESLRDFNQALNKIRAVIDHSDKDQLASLDADIEAIPKGSQFPLDGEDKPISTDQPQSSDRWLRECRSTLVRRQVVQIGYTAISSFYYSWHWHLIAWCRLRQGYRDFRLDRIETFDARDEQFARHSRLTLQEYLSEQPGRDELQEVELLFGPQAARFVGEQRYMFGFLDEERQEDGVKMRFLTSVPDYMSRWLLQYTDDVKIIKGEAIRQALQAYSAALAAHWGDHYNPANRS